MKQMMKVAIVAVGCVALMTIGCGGGSDDEGTDANTPTPDTTDPTPDTTVPTPDTTVPTPDATLPPPIDMGPPPQPAGTCQTVLDCVTQCNPNDIQACMAACLGNASPEVQAQFNGMLQCQGGCPGAEANTVDIACLVETCFDDAHACLGKPNTNLACGDIFLCIQGCPQTAQNCPFECLMSATDKATIDTFFAIGDCFSEACPLKPGETAENLSEETNDCLEAAQAAGGACADTVTACLGPMPAGKPGMSLIWSGMMRWIFDVQHWMHFQF